MPHRQCGPLPLRDGQAGGVPVEEPRQRLASGAHTLLFVRGGLQEQAHNPDVLPRRSFVRPGPDLPVGARSEGSEADDLVFRPRDDRAGVGFGLQVRHRARRPKRDPDGEPQMTPELTPSQTVGPFFHDALLDRDRSELVSPDHPKAVRIEGTVYDGQGSPCPTRWSRSGRPMGPADTTTTQITERTCRWTRVSPASDAPGPMPAADSPS